MLVTVGIYSEEVFIHLGGRQKSTKQGKLQAN